MKYLKCSCIRKQLELLFDETFHVNGNSDVEGLKSSCLSLPFLKSGIYVDCNFIALRNADDVFSSLGKTTGNHENGQDKRIFGIIPEAGKKGDATAAVIRSIDKMFVCSSNSSVKEFANWKFADLCGNLAMEWIMEHGKPKLNNFLDSLPSENAKFLQVNSQCKPNNTQ
jgi:hypothetical protein